MGAPLEYTSVCHEPQLGEAGAVDIYRPDSPGPHPFVLAIHGGAWVRRDYQCIYHAMLWPKIKPLGYALVLPTYRLAPEYHFPCAYDDLLHLLAWLRTHGEAQGLDMGKCALLGSSAGGHLAMLLATRAILEKRPMPEIRGVVQYCGIMDLTDLYRIEEAHGGAMVKTFMGTTPEINPALYRDASPICHLHRAVPPVWMAHGTTDPCVPVAQSRVLFKGLMELGHDPVYFEARGLDHTMLERTVDGGPWIEPWVILFEHDMFRFLKRVLG
jgi:acetyl esterase/lipase